MWTDVGWLLLNPGGDVLQNKIYISGSHYEEAIYRFIDEQSGIGPGDIIFDVGGHIGYYSLLFARIVGPDGYVLTFEPQSDLATALQNSLKLNQINWVTVENLAISDISQSLKLYQPTDTGRTSAVDVLEGKPILVNSMSLDEYLSNTPNCQPTLIKLDIEGAEWLALSGMSNLLQRPSPPRLLIEMHKQQIESLGGTPENLVEMLKETGKFRLFQIHHERGLQPLMASLPDSTTWHLYAEPIHQ